jgi:hypothetical protein
LVGLIKSNIPNIKIAKIAKILEKAKLLKSLSNEIAPNQEFI